MTKERLTSAQAVEAAIKTAAQKANRVDTSSTVSDRIAQEYFRRFLSRIFSRGDSSGWVLKGGSGLLARVGSARSTKYTGSRPAIGLQQPYTEGLRVSFDVYVGANRRGVVNVDLVVNAIVTEEPTVTPPANGLFLPKLQSYDYRIYSVVDQIADKVCATLAIYPHGESSREWDLVDLVVLATTVDIDGNKLGRAIRVEADARRIHLPSKFTVPDTWGRRYAKDAKPVPACADYRNVELALGLMTKFLDPVFRREATDKTWFHEKLRWI